MIYIHYCPSCRAVRMQSGHKTRCPACSASMPEQKITFTEYTNMSQKERDRFLEDLLRKYS